VTKNHFEPGAYSNATALFSPYRFTTINTTTGKEYGDIGYQTDSHDIQLFNSMLEGNNGNTPSYKDLTPFECMNFYNTDLMSNYRNLFVITNYTSNAEHNNTILFMGMVNHQASLPYEWMCYTTPLDSRCNPDNLISEVASGRPWLVNLGTRGVGEISACKSERVAEECKVEFSLGIMIAVICCNLVKACCMVMTVVRSREPTLVTLGDAIDSFLRIPDPTTMGVCFADRQLIEKEWRRRWRTAPRQWNQKGVQRWWTSVSKTRLITCNFFCSVAIIITGVLLRSGIRKDREFMGTDIKSL